jgi:pimeloyl-ACP methyl ester carboxylesterase
VREHGFPDSRGVVPERSPGWSPATLKERPEIARTNLRESESTDPEAWARAALAVTQHDTRADLPRIEVPVLLIWGADDRMVPVDHAAPLQAGLPQAELHVLDGAGHTANLEQPDAFSALLVDFFRRHPTAPAGPV